jgi:hypothetical protein
MHAKGRQELPRSGLSSTDYGLQRATKVRSSYSFGTFLPRRAPCRASCTFRETGRQTPDFEARVPGERRALPGAHTADSTCPIALLSSSGAIRTATASAQRRGGAFGVRCYGFSGGGELFSFNVNKSWKCLPTTTSVESTQWLLQKLSRSRAPRRKQRNASCR